MDKYLFFSGDKPTLEDENFSRDALMAGIVNRIKDHFTDGVVTGLTLSKVEGQLKIAPGVAYRSGVRIWFPTGAGTTWPAVDSFVFVSYAYTDGSPKVHHITGATHNTRRVYSFSLVVKTSSTPLPNEVLVGQVIVSPEEIVDLRSFCQVIADPRIHTPNTDTHTTAAEFRVDGAAGPLVLTVENAVDEHPELLLLLRHGLVNFQDGHGDRLIQTRKVPSSPNAPMLDLADATLKVISTAPERSVAMRASLDSYLAAKVGAEALTEHLSLIESYRVLVNEKRLLGWTLDQIRGDALVGGVYNTDVTHLKNELIVAGAAGIEREVGSLTMASGNPVASGVGTALSGTLVGKKLLVSINGALEEYTVDSVDVGDQKVTFTENASSTVSGVHFWLSEVGTLGYGSSASEPSHMLVAVDGLRIGKQASRERLASEKLAHGSSVLSQYDADDTDQEDSYSLLLSWDKPALVDLEEITGYRIRVYELSNTRTPVAQGIARTALESGHLDLIYRTTDSHTTQRQKVEAADASSTTASGSTTTVVKVASAALFQPNTRVVVSGASRTIKSVDTIANTLTLFTALPVAPSAGVPVASYKIVWDAEVATESLQRPVRPGQHLVIYAQAITEYEVASPWSAGLVILTDDLETADGKTLKELVTERMSAKRLRSEIQRDQLSFGYQDRIIALERAIAGAATKAETAEIIKAIETP